MKKIRKGTTAILGASSSVANRNHVFLFSSSMIRSLRAGPSTNQRTNKNNPSYPPRSGSDLGQELHGDGAGDVVGGEAAVGDLLGALDRLLLLRQALGDPC